MHWCFPLFSSVMLYLNWNLPTSWIVNFFSINQCSHPKLNSAIFLIQTFKFLSLLSNNKTTTNLPNSSPKKQKNRTTFHITTGTCYTLAAIGKRGNFFSEIQMAWELPLDHLPSLVIGRFEERNYRSIIAWLSSIFALYLKAIISHKTILYRHEINVMKSFL